MQKSLGSYFQTKKFCKSYKFSENSINSCNKFNSKINQINLNEIIHLDEIVDWFNQIYLPIIENPKLVNKTLMTGDLNDITSSLGIFGKYGARITFRYYSTIQSFLNSVKKTI